MSDSPYEPPIPVLESDDHKRVARWLDARFATREERSEQRFSAVAGRLDKLEKHVVDVRTTVAGLHTAVELDRNARVSLSERIDSLLLHLPSRAGGEVNSSSDPEAGQSAVQIGTVKVGMPALSLFALLIVVGLMFLMGWARQYGPDDARETMRQLPMAAPERER